MKDKDKIFQKWYNEYASYMFGICLRYSGNKEEAKDIMQDGFISVYESMENFKSKSKAKTWIGKIMINTAVTYYRKKNFNMFDYDDEFTNYNEGEDNDIISKIQLEDLLRVINELPTGYRLVFNLYAIEGYSHKEIADILKITEGTSRSQIVRARTKIQKALSNNY